MLNVDALTHLHNEVLIQIFQLTRLRNVYGILDQEQFAVSNMDKFFKGFVVLGEDEYLEELAWLISLSQQRRHQIRERQEDLKWRDRKLRWLHNDIDGEILLNNTWLQFSSVLSDVLPNTDILKMIWDCMFKNNNRNDM